tara:strand:+ start:109 stop:258 length:150 start_codon:yes stop_codon:yes gene_type:complete
MAVVMVVQTHQAHKMLVLMAPTIQMHQQVLVQVVVEVEEEMVEMVDLQH